MDLSDINNSLVKTEAGLWFNIADSNFRLAFAYSYKFQQSVGGVMNMRNLTLADLCDSLANDVLLDWSGVKDLNNDDVPYTKAMASHALQSNKQLLDFVMDVAFKQSNYRQGGL